MPSQPNSHKGTLILLAANASNANVSTSNSYFVFQYNPEKLLHTFNQAMPNALSSTTTMETTPVELFTLAFDLDSTDLDPSEQNQTADTLGIHPALAMLELMMQPQKVGAQTIMPIAVFNWGAKRSVAVRFVSMSVEEQAFDVALNPIRAVVNLTLRVLDVSEVGGNSGAKGICLGHQGVRESLVDAYKLQTGQGGSAAGGAAASGVSSSAAASMGSVASASNLKSTATKVKTIKTIRSR